MTALPDAEILARGSQLSRGRKFDAAELRLMLLWLLQQSPGHGYELARRLRELSHGYYAPSPGALYPALAQLESDGLLRSETSGKRRTHHINPAGIEQLRQQREQADTLLAILRHAGRRMLWLQQAGQDQAAATAATGWLPEYVEARRALKSALLALEDADHDAQRRIIEVLQHATAELAALHRNAAAP